MATGIVVEGGRALPLPPSEEKSCMGGGWGGGRDEYVKLLYVPLGVGEGIQ
jgi:hypothetical protein